MKHLFFSLSRFAVVFLSSSLVFFALLVVTGRLLTPFLNHQTQAIEQFTADLLHKPVQVKQFSVIWRGLLPILQGEDVIIWNDSRTQPLLQVKQLDVGINLVKTLLTGSIKLGEVRGLGAELAIHQTKDNQFIVNGFNTALAQPEKDQPNSINALLGWLLEPQLSLQNIKLSYYPVSGEKWPEMQLSAAIENKNNHHYLSAQLQFIGTAQPENLTLIADMTGSVEPSLNNLKGQFYLEGHSVLLDRWIALVTKKYTLQQGVANFKLWSDWQQAHFTKIQALVAHTENSVIQIAKEPPLTLMPFSANIEWQSASDNSWAVNAIVRNFGFLAWKKIPGVKGLNAYAHVTPNSGNFTAHSRNLDVDFKKLFKAPIHLDDLYSELNWQRKTDATLIKVTKFSAVNADASANGQMGLLIPANNATPIINLLAHVKTKRPSQIGSYLLLPFVGHELVQWLDSAIIKGKGDGSVILQGSLSEFPFDKNDGTFLIDTQIHNAELHYESDWPNLQNINGELVFSGRQMQMVVDSAEIFGVDLKDIRANIPLIKTHVQAMLHIATDTINTQLEKGLDFLQATPLAKELGGLSSLELTGPLKLALQLTVPLESGKEKLKVAGTGITQNAKANIPSHNIQIDDLKGQFSVSETSVQAQNLMGVLWNKPINIGIRSVPKTQLVINYDGIDTVLSPEGQGWRFSVNNKLAKGSILIPNNKEQAIEANFDSLVLNSESSAQSEWSFKQIPAINLIAKDVRYNKMDFGKVQLKLRPVLAGIAIRGLQAGNASYHLIANGVWHRQENKKTEFIGQLDSPDLSSFLRSWGLPASLTAEQAHIRFNLQWSGAPYEINLAKLQGSFSFNAANGQIVDIGSSAEAKLGFGRLLTFLSLQSLGKRLQLDFSDLQAKGFDFTSMQGHFNLRAGNAITRDLTIEGPVAAISIMGRVGLQAKDYDLRIKVLPHFTSSLPVIVGLAGGPIAGAITWVANAVLGSTVQKIAETSYHITGSWAKPNIQKNT
ncbi:membrane protein-like protein [Candidatus Rickettsiella viridis]|uniref:Membrane protein-like protein n=1 Tax=Candidatus Rickettsiella viridis TaxID=676208 RepID=A0A2Z5UVI1_9COXI|nr:AsmA-like C-terminal region-containing protein [Candidatus Rickettsiella viridis]BBB15031.1 membrane protein-like protein [Candidatus Rickettsiella viridis]